MLRGNPFAFLQDGENYSSRQVAEQTWRCGLGVSTAWTSDEGYETAIGDRAGWHPVERYESRESAEAGHARWTALVETRPTTILKLGRLIIGDSAYVLKPYADDYSE